MEILIPYSQQWIDHLYRELIRNNTVDQIDLADIYGLFHPIAEEFIIFSSAHGTFSMIDHLLEDKISLNKFKILRNISSIFSSHNGGKLEINNWNKPGKFTNTWKLSSTVLNNTNKKKKKTP